jgi:hypothetical protein
MPGRADSRSSWSLPSSSEGRGHVSPSKRRPTDPPTGPLSAFFNRSTLKN